LRRRSAVLVVLCGALAVLPPSAAPAQTRSCGSIDNPYPETRYEGADLRRIRATAVSCSTARRVARLAHRKAIGLTPPASGVRRFSWAGWRVTGNLRGATDRYVARRGARRVTWLF
jgi:hypothetical protein